MGPNMSTKLSKSLQIEIANHAAQASVAVPRRKLSTVEAAEFLGVSKSYLDKLRCNGDGPVHAKLGRRVIYDVRELESWVEQRMRRHTSETA